MLKGLATTCLHYNLCFVLPDLPDERNLPPTHALCLIDRFIAAARSLISNDPAFWFLAYSSKCLGIANEHKGNKKVRERTLPMS